MALLGILATILLALAGVPQLIKVLREGHAEGLSLATLWLWVAGLLTFCAYVLVEHPGDYVLLFNYGSNLVVVGALLFWKLFPRKK